MTQEELKLRVAQELEALCSVGHPLHPEAAAATWRIHAVSGSNPHIARYTPHRVRVHGELIEQFRGENEPVVRDGLAAVATAGPPASGKSHRLHQLGYGPGWRRIDADDFKARLIIHDLSQGSLKLPDPLANLVLADGDPVMPMELSGLYHHESTLLADKARQVCMAANENVVVEGTLSWSGMVTQLIQDLVTNNYERLDVVLVEVPFEKAVEQALER